MNCDRKYVRVRKANAKLPSTFLSSSASAVSLSSVPRLIKSEPSEERSGGKNRSTTANGLRTEEQIVLNRVACDGPIELLTSYPGYEGSIDGIRKHFTSTTILNGAAVTEVRLNQQRSNMGSKTSSQVMSRTFPTQVKYLSIDLRARQHLDLAEDSGSSDSVLVVPAETDELVEPTEAMMSDGLVRTVRVSGADLEQAFANGCGGFFHRENDDSYVMTADLVGSCYLAASEEAPVARVKQRASATSQSNWLMKKTVKVDKVPPFPGKTVISGTNKRGLIRFGRSRMIADTHTCIPVSEFKAQLNDTSDIVGKFDIAPPTKREMHVLNTKGVNKLFANPGRNLSSRCMHQFVRHLTMTQKPVDVTFDDMPLQPVGFTPEVDPTKIKRITRKRRYPEAEEYQRNLYNSQMALTFLNTVDTVTEDPQTEYIEEEVIVPENKDSIVQFELIDSSNQDTLGDGNIIYPQGLITDDVGLMEVEVEEVLQEELLESEPQLQVSLLESEPELQENLLEMQTNDDFLESSDQEERLLGDRRQISVSVLRPTSGDGYVRSTDTILLDPEFIGPERDYLERDRDMKPTILMVQDGSHIDQYNQEFTQQNIEVLLAAAEKNGISRASIQQVIICQGEDGTDEATFLSSSGQILVMPSDPLNDAITETVMIT